MSSPPRPALPLCGLALGGAPLGNLFASVPDADALATVEAAWNAGVRAFDTAPLYGLGLSERRLGRALADRSREEFAVSTKVGRLFVESGHPAASPDADIYADVPAGLAPRFDFSRDGVLRSLEASLERLGLDHVDVLYIHDPDEHWEQAVGEAYPTLHELRDQGVVRAIGAGMNQAEMLTRFIRETDMDVVQVAGRYTLLDHAPPALELLSACEERGRSVVASSLFNSGVLVDPDRGATFDYAPASDEIVRRARAVGEVCRRHDVPVAAAALQFPLGQPAVASVLVGARARAEIEANARAFAHPVPGELWRELREEGLIAAGVPVPA